jgi:hypothetical protein
MQYFVHPRGKKLYGQGRTFLVWRWLMLAACHQDADPSGKIRTVLASRFDLGCLDKIPYRCHRGTYNIWPGLVGEVKFELAALSRQVATHRYLERKHYLLDAIPSSLMT